MSGEVAELFLIDAHGCIVLNNYKAEYIRVDEGPGANKTEFIRTTNGSRIDIRIGNYESKVAFDGILISGSPRSMSDELHVWLHKFCTR